jgi:hypothetical protein
MCLQNFIFRLPFSWNRKSRLCHDLSSVEPSKFKLLVLRLCRHELGEKVAQFMLINTNLTSYLWKTCSGMHTSIRIVFVICNNAASAQRINLFDRLQHARYEHHIVVVSVYKRLHFNQVFRWHMTRASELNTFGTSDGDTQVLRPK